MTGGGPPLSLPLRSLSAEALPAHPSPAPRVQPPPASPAAGPPCCAGGHRQRPHFPASPASGRGFARRASGCGPAPPAGRAPRAGAHTRVSRETRIPPPPPTAASTRPTSPPRPLPNRRPTSPPRQKEAPRSQRLRGALSCAGRGACARPSGSAALSGRCDRMPCSRCCCPGRR